MGTASSESFSNGMAELESDEEEAGEDAVAGCRDDAIWYWRPMCDADKPNRSSDERDFFMSTIRKATYQKCMKLE